jgi:hypothetical protein
MGKKDKSDYRNKFTKVMDLVENDYLRDIDRTGSQFETNLALAIKHNKVSLEEARLMCEREEAEEEMIRWKNRFGILVWLLVGVMFIITYIFWLDQNEKDTEKRIDELLSSYDKVVEVCGNWADWNECWEKCWVRTDPAICNECLDRLDRPLAENELEKFIKELDEKYSKTFTEQLVAYQLQLELQPDVSDPIFTEATRARLAEMREDLRKVPECIYSILIISSHIGTIKDREVKDKKDSKELAEALKLENKLLFRMFPRSVRIEVIKEWNKRGLVN